MGEVMLVGDVGGTNARFALAEAGTSVLRAFTSVANAGHASLGEAIRAYLAATGARPRHAALAVAGPVAGETFSFTNSPWSFERAALAEEVGLERLDVLNDFEALALSLPVLAGDDLAPIGGGEAVLDAVKLVLGPGTGLGVGALARDADGWRALPGEGGHVALAAESAAEFALIEKLRGAQGRVSAERVLSGPGLEVLHGALHGEARSAAEIAACGLAEPTSRARATLDLFVSWLGRFAGDAALMLGARGGVYLGGGIAPRIRPLLESGAFRAGFEAKGRMSGLVAAMPVWIILAPDAPLRGAARGLEARLGKAGES